MSNITNGGLTRSGTGRSRMAAVGVKSSDYKIHLYRSSSIL